MRKTLAVLGLFLATATASAQQGLGQNKAQINGGVGLSGLGIPVYLGVDYGIARDFTIGAEVSYSSKKVSNGYFEDRYSIFGFGVNGNYYFNRLLKLPREFDVYAGATLVYFNVSNSQTYSGPSILREHILSNYSSIASSGLDYGFQVGGRYFFTKNLGVNLELGGGSYAVGGKLGLTYRFN
mgnify:CR=1 FL=1